MNDERLAELRAQLDARSTSDDTTTGDLIARELLAEVDRYRAGIDIVLSKSAAAVEDVARGAKRLRTALEEIQRRTIQRDLWHIARDALEGTNQKGETRG